ncbi:MAG: hypothetical protein ACYC0V_13210 [Armatimonadota bacterium]
MALLQRRIMISLGVLANRSVAKRTVHRFHDYPTMIHHMNLWLRVKSHILNTLTLYLTNSGAH